MKERIEKVKNHFAENKAVYVAVGITASVSVILTLSVVGIRGLIITKPIITVNGNGNTTTYAHVALSQRRGHPGYVIRCLETGKVFFSQRHAAAEMGLSQSTISKHLNGTLQSVDGFTFERIGEAV
jgi:hypothetical protein